MLAPSTQRTARSKTARRFSCRRSTVDGAVHVAIGGELDIASVGQLDAALRLAWASADTIVLDVRGLEFIDFSGTTLLTEADRRIRRSGGRLIVVRGSADLEWLFALYGIDRVLEFVDPTPAGVPAGAANRDAAARELNGHMGVAASSR